MLILRVLKVFLLGVFGELENDNSVVLIKTYFCLYIIYRELESSERTKQYLDGLNVYLITYKESLFGQTVSRLIKPKI